MNNDNAEDAVRPRASARTAQGWPIGAISLALKSETAARKAMSVPVRVVWVESEFATITEHEKEKKE